MNIVTKKSVGHLISVDGQQRAKVLESLARFCPSQHPLQESWHVQPNPDKAYTVRFLTAGEQLSIIEWGRRENGWEEVCSHSDIQEFLMDLAKFDFPA